MARDPNIPLFLWVAAAIVAHLTWGGGAEPVAGVIEVRAEDARFAASGHNQLRQRFCTEIALIDDSAFVQEQRAPDDAPYAPDAPPDEEPPKDEVEPDKKDAPRDQP